MAYLAPVSALAVLVVVVLAALFRSRPYAVFRAVTLGVHTLIVLALAPRFAAVLPLYVYLHASVYAHSLSLVWPRMRPLGYRLLVSIPAAFFGAGTLLSLPWAVLAAFGVRLPLVWLPYAVAAVGVAQSLWSREEDVDVVVRDGHVVDGVKRHRVARGAQRAPAPHRADHRSAPRALHVGLAAAAHRPARGRTPAGPRGAHRRLPHHGVAGRSGSARPRARAAGSARGARVRVPRQPRPRGPDARWRTRSVASAPGFSSTRRPSSTPPPDRVQILGVDFAWRGRSERLAATCQAHPRRPGALRVVLLHDPGAFKHLPPGEADLVLSGHTHGGQVGLVSLGLPWTMLRVLMNAPDHGLWARGTDRLYVHRGTGHYGFPLRLGVPAEQSLLRVHAPAEPRVSS